MRFLLVRLALIALFVAFAVDFWYGRAVMSLEHLVPAAQNNSAAQGSPPPEAVRTTAPIDTAIILSRNIFKAALEAGDQSSVEPGLDLDALEETTMKLVLLGTVSGSQEDARAIIRDETEKKEDIYQVGSSVQGALVSRIERGRVVLQVDGREEILNIKDPESGGASGSAPPAGGASSLAAPPNVEEPAGPNDRPELVDDRKVPEALPRRRISFRNAIPPPIPPDSGPANDVSANTPGAEPPTDASVAPPMVGTEQPGQDHGAEGLLEEAAAPGIAPPND